MSRLGPRQRQARSQQRTAWILGTVSAAILAGIVFLFIRALDTDVLDPNTLCVEDVPPQEFWAVLVDVTDGLNPVQRTSLEQRFEDLKEDIPQGAMLALFKVDDEPDAALEPLAALCNPGSGEELSVLTSNPDIVRRKWERQFVQPLDSMLTTVLVADELPRSPIMEMVRNVKVASDSYDAPKRRLIIFSDMLQHSDAFSHYARGPIPYSQVRQYELGGVKTNLSSWDVVIHYVRREDGRAQQIQGRGHIEFWDDYFSDIGATLSEVIRVDG